MTNQSTINTLGSSTGFGRVQSLDILRGAVMVLMAIDHVRVYAGLPAGSPEPGIFFTRWITHFCAPTFVFLSGTSAFLYGNKVGDKGELARYLVSRGLLLVILELTLVRLSWTFRIDYSQFVMAGVIWMLGWCMVLLAAVVRFRPAVIGFAGLAIIMLQQLFSWVPQALPESMRSAFGLFWEFIYPTGLEAAFGMAVLYVLVPWVGVMAAGYGFGLIVLMEPGKRRKICLRIGFSAIALFIIIGSALILWSPPNPEAPPFLFRLLNQAKYPASQLFLMMTLGPVIALAPVVDNLKGKLADVIAVFGRVPFFYYLLHIPLIHLSALLVQLMNDGVMHPEWYTSAPFAQVPEASRWSLGLLYLVFLIDVVILYFVCRWYAKYKSDHPEKKWLKFL